MLLLPHPFCETPVLWHVITRSDHRNGWKGSVSCSALQGKEFTGKSKFPYSYSKRTQDSQRPWDAPKKYIGNNIANITTTGPQKQKVKTPKILR